MNSILISNAHLCNFGGSELVSVELAEFYAARGWRVVLYSPIVGQPLLSTISPNVIVTSKEPDLFGWDIIWDHHGLLINKITRDSARIIVCNHMSSYVDLERPKYEVNKPDRIFANSQETVLSMSVPHMKRAELFQNPAPAEFQRVNHGGSYILAISNHRPKGLRDALDALDIPVRYISMHENPQRLSGKHHHDNLFFGARAVVCNGKSVQYALRAGVPVFIYDHFGGPGWLTEENFDRASHFNFSGRGFDACPVDALSLWPIATPVSMERINWRYKLEEWLYYKELI